MTAKKGLENYVFIPIGKLELAPWNYKNDDPDQAEKLKENIKRNGQIVNVNVRPITGGKYEVIDGNHRLTALRDLGVAKVVAYKHGKITLDAAKRISIELNETRFSSDDLKLIGILEEVRDAYPEDYEDTIPDNVLRKLALSEDGPPIEPPDEEPSGITCPHCGGNIQGKLVLPKGAKKKEGQRAGFSS